MQNFLKIENRHLKLVLFISLFLIILINANAQVVISGMILDTKKLPIEYANVILTDLQSGKIKTGLITNKKGEFNINIADSCSCKITISFVGYKDWYKNIIINQSHSLGVITLFESENKLDEVIIKGQKAVITRNGDKLVFNVQSSPLKSGYDGIELLKNTPNVYLDSDDNILMRDESATVLINGKKIYLSGSDLSNHLSNLSSDNIQSIEIQTNKSSNADASSTGGIINIVLKEKAKGYSSQIKSYCRIKGDKYYTIFTGFNFNYRRDKWNFYSTYNYRNGINANDLFTKVNFVNDTLSNQTYTGIETPFNLHNYQAGFVKQIYKNHELGIDIFGVFNNYNSIRYGNTFYYHDGSEINNGKNDSKIESNDKRFNGVLSYEWTISSNDKLKIVANFTNNLAKRNSVNESLYKIQTEYYQANIGRYFTNSETDIYVLQIDYLKSFKNKLNLDFGIKYISADRLSSSVSEICEGDTFIINDIETEDFNYTESIKAVYTSVNKKFKKKNFLQFGIRLENTNIQKNNFVNKTQINQNYIDWFPSLYYSRNLDSKKSISAGYSYSLRRPSFRELNNNITKVNDFQYFLGNPKLQPEYINKYELNYDFNKNRISLYYHNTSNAINGVYFIENNIAYYKKFNSGSQIQFGIELNISKKLKKWWFLTLSTNLYNRKFINEQAVSMFQKNTFGIKLFNNFKINESTEIDLSCRYRSPKTDAFYQADEIYYVDFTFKKSFFNKKLNFRIYVNDIFNTRRHKNNREFDFYNTQLDNKAKSRFISLWFAYNIANNKVNKKTYKNDTNNRL